METSSPHADLEAALRAALQPEYQDRAGELARALLTAAASPDDPRVLADPTLRPLLRALAGAEVRTGESLVSFDHAQLGDVTFQGDIAGRDIVRVTLNLVKPPSALAPQEQRNRQRMIQKVRDFWIRGVLEQSLHGVALVTLGLEPTPDAISFPWEMIVEREARLPRPIAPGTRLVDVFDESGGAMLLLGEPGSGKTTMLLDLARSLLDRTEQDEAAPLPVIFNLSSWAAQRAPLEAWLVSELTLRYDVPRSIGRSWVDADQILPLLDGLDEVAVEHRTLCVEQLNRFRAAHGMGQLVVCSRSEDYRALTTRLRLATAVTLQPLTPAQVSGYLVQGGPATTPVRDLIDRDAVFRELALSPLMLSVMVLAYQGVEPSALPTTGTLEEQRHHLFTTYVQRMLQRRGGPKRYTPDKLRHWLTWLAQRMTERSETVFLLERLQPDWLPESGDRRWYRFGEGIARGGILGVIVTFLLSFLTALWMLSSIGLTGDEPSPELRATRAFIALFAGFFLGFVAFTVPALMAGVIADLVGGRASLGDTAIDRAGRVSRVFGLCFGSILAVPLVLIAQFGSRTMPGGEPGSTFTIASGLFFAIIVGSVAWGLCRLVLSVADQFVAAPGRIVLVETIGWSSRAALTGMLRGGLAGLTAGLLLGTLVGGGAQGIATGLVIAVVVALVAGVGRGLMVREIDRRGIPNEGIRRSLRNALWSGGTVALVTFLSIFIVSSLARRYVTPQLAEFDVGLVDVLDLFFPGPGISVALAILIGTSVGMLYGGLPVIQHFTIRWRLARRGSAPWRYARMLDEATDHILLRRVGGGYLFVHRLLLEHFAGPTSHMLPSVLLDITSPPPTSGRQPRPLSRLRLGFLFSLFCAFSTAAAVCISLAAVGMFTSPAADMGQLWLAFLPVVLVLAGAVLGYVAAPPLPVPRRTVLARVVGWGLGLPVIVAIGLVLYAVVATLLPIYAGPATPTFSIGVAVTLSMVGLVGALLLYPRAQRDPRPARPRRPFSWIIALGLAGLFLLAGGLWWWESSSQWQIAAPGLLPTEEPLVERVRARVDIPEGTVISDTVSLLEVVEVPISAFNPDEEVAYVGDVEGARAIRDIFASEPIQWDALDVGTEVLIANVDIPAGTVITDVLTLLATEHVYGSAYRPEQLFETWDEIYGARTVAPIAARQPIERASLDPATLPNAPINPWVWLTLVVVTIALATLILALLRRELARNLPARRGRSESTPDTPARPRKRLGRWVLTGIVAYVALLLVSYLTGRYLLASSSITPVNFEAAPLPPEMQPLPTEVPVVEVIRARVDIPANTVLTDTLTLIEVITIPQTEFDPENNFSSVEDVEGAITRQAVRANELLSRQNIFRPEQIVSPEPPVTPPDFWSTLHLVLTISALLLTILVFTPLSSQLRHLLLRARTVVGNHQ